jgi:ParB/RepB/Spo0J family partition protein
MQHDYWTNVDIAFLLRGILPKGRNIKACRVYCRRNGIKFPGKKFFDNNEMLLRKFETKYNKEGTQMKNEKVKTYTASIKDARPDKPSDDKERSYSFRSIAIDKVLADSNIRSVNDISDLVASIEAHGIINPITVVSDFSMSTYYRVVAGFRRFAAAKKLGIKKIPCHVLDNECKELREISLSENVSRISMAPYEECIAVKNLVSKKNTVQQIAKKFGRTIRWVLVRKKLADAGKEVLEKVKNGKVQLGAAAKLADLPDDAFKEAINFYPEINDSAAKSILEKHHIDISKAPFNHEACLKCDKCSACQKDLFEDEPKTYCLDPVCWKLKVHDFAKEKVSNLQNEGKNARIADIDRFGIHYGDDANRYEIKKWEKNFLEEAKKAGIEKRILVSGETAETYEYYDKRDLPDFHEETEEEREEKREKERLDSIRNDIYRDRLREKIVEVCFNFKPEADRIVALLTLVADNNYDFFEDDGKKTLGIYTSEDEINDKSIFEMPEDKTFRAVADAVRQSSKSIMGTVYSIADLEKIYRIVGIGIDLEKLKPTDDEVIAENDRRNAEKTPADNDCEDKNDEESSSD